VCRPLVIGLTGGIASGKSTVANRFIELGVPLIDADIVSRAVVQPGTKGLSQIIERFGSEVLNPQGELDRGRLRSHIFGDVVERKALEAILHPLIRDEMNAQAQAVLAPYLVMAIPLLVEGGSPHRRVDRVLVVDVPESVQITRLLARDGSTEDQARAILASQATREARLAEADDVITNTVTVTELRQSVDRLHTQYLQQAQNLSAR
jgi:dephospho-CoA kinase